MHDPSVATAARRRIDELVEQNDKLQQSHKTIRELNQNLRDCIRDVRLRSEDHHNNEPRRWLICFCAGVVLATILCALVL